MSESMVRVERDGHIARIWMARSEKRNALNTEFCRQLVEAFESVENDDDVRVIVFGGEGPVFCAGQDLAFTSAATLDEWEEYRVWNRRIRDKIQHIGKPVVARVHGHALGGGMWLATCCDLIVAAESAEFAMREIHAGVHSGSAHILTVGRQRAMEINMLGRRITAAEAERWDLINKVVPDDRIDEGVKEFTDQLLALPPLGLKYTKVAANLLLQIAGHYTVLDASPGHPYLFLTEDSREAKLSFVEKRKPAFTGKRPQR